MTREEFVARVRSMSDLVSFCHKNYLIDYISEVYVDEQEFNSMFDIYITEEIKNNGWNSVYDALKMAIFAKENLKTGYFYVEDLSRVSPATNIDFLTMFDVVKDIYEWHYGFDDDHDNKSSKCTTSQTVAPIIDEEMADVTLLLELTG